MKYAFVSSEICVVAFNEFTAIAVGAAGAGVAAVVVVIAAGATAKFETEKTNGPPLVLEVVLRMATVAGLAVLVKLHWSWAPGKTLAAGMVNTPAANVPKLVGLPVKLELASLQVAEVKLKLAFAASVICICVLAAVTCMAVGVAGAATPAAVVEIFAIVVARFAAVNVNGPPNAPTVVFCNVRVGGFGTLVKVQTILANVFRFTTGTVMTLPDKVPKLAGFPEVAALVSVQTPADKLKLLFAASVKVTGVLMLVTEM